MTTWNTIHRRRRLFAAIAVIAFAASGVAAAADKKTEQKTEDDSPGDFTRRIEMRPGEKRALELRHDERNPFGRDLGQIKVIEAKEGVPEEDRIRKIFSQLTIGGRSIGPSGPRVLVGDLILEEGQVVPPVLEDQTDRLVVNKITEDEIELAWFDGETGDLTGRRMNLRFDLKPTVNYILNGQRGRSGDASAPPKPVFARMRMAAQPPPKPDPESRGGEEGSRPVASSDAGDDDPSPAPDMASPGTGARIDPRGE